MKKNILLLLLLAFVAFTASAQKKVAILETVDKEGNVPYAVRLMLRTNLTYAISNTPGFEGFDRVDMASIMGEQNFQRTGMVSDDQIRRLGEMTGCSSILVAEAAIYDNSHVLVTAKILNVETASVENSAPPQIASTSPEELQEACMRLASKLIGAQGVTSTPGTPKAVVDNNKPNAPTTPVSTTVNVGDATSSNSHSPAITADTVTISVGGMSFVMVRVEAGSFTMGSTYEIGRTFGNDQPTHEVIISKDYYIGKYEVTQKLWETVMGVNSSRSKGADKPVEFVSWQECQEFCARLSRMTGMQFRLPTEAEWEYAARGGKKSKLFKYSGSSDVASSAWYKKNSGKQTHPVGQLCPNELGIYDMSGNVWECCQDYYGNYEAGQQTDPQGPAIGATYVMRGGSCLTSDDFCLVSFRLTVMPKARFKDLGFRVVLVP